MTASPDTVPAPIKKLFASVFRLIAAGTLLFEVLLTRIFSVTLWYHFGFLAISLALLGTAASAVICYLYPEQLAGTSHRRNLSLFAGLFALMTPLAIAFHLDVDLPGYASVAKFSLVFGTQLTLFFVVFFCSGMCISITLYRCARQISRVYFFDLAGASMGSLLVVPLLYHISGPALVFVVSAVAFLGAWAFAANTNRALFRHMLLVAAVACVGLAAINDRCGILEITNVKNYARSTLQAKEARKVFEKWSPVSRVAVFEPVMGTPPWPEKMMVTADAGAPTALHHFNGDLSTAGFVKGEFRQAVHWVKPNADTLIVGSAGGVDVLAALAFNQKRITAVEINPVTAYLVSEKYADYIGHIFQNPKVTLYVQEGRNFVAGSADSYDIIQLTMIDSWSGTAAGSYLFNEASLYTVDAVHDYMSHLKPGGVLAITRYYWWHEALRLTNICVSHLLSRGITDTDKRIIVLLQKPAFGRQATVLLKNGQFTPAEVDRAAAAAANSGGSVIHAPFLERRQLAGDSDAERFRILIDPSKRAQLMDEMIAHYPADISPSTDDRPFFFFTSRLADVIHPDRNSHPARWMALPLLYGMVVLFGLIALLTVFLPLYLRSRDRRERIRYRWRSLLYFSLLGLGFMLFEISLIQRLTVFLGHPTWSFVVVLSTLLLCSGLGSLYSARWPEPNPRILRCVLGAVSVSILVFAGVVYDQFGVWMALTKAVRVLVAAGMTAPLGFLLGMCFPMGVVIVRRYSASLVPWAGR